MSNEIVRSGVGQWWVRQEASLGSSSASWEGMYMEGLPQIPSSTVKMIANSIAGYRNPLSRGKPVGVDMAQDSAFRFKQRIRRVVTDGNASTMTYMFEAGGWKEDAGSATTVNGAGTTTAFDVASIGSIAAGECILIELVVNSTTIYYPCLVADVTGTTITPAIALPAAPADSAIVEVMNSFTPTSSTGQQVPTNKTCQFRLNSLRYYDDAVGDGAVLLTGCAVSDLGTIEIGGVGTTPMLDWGFHVGKAEQTADDIGADSFTDTDRFLVVDDKFCEFSFAANNAGSGIAALVKKPYTKLTFTTGLKTSPVKAQGDGNSLGGNQAYVMMNEAPRITVEAYGVGDPAYDNEMFDQLAGDNESKYFHWVQPVTNLDYPAFGIWLPCCHIAPDGEPKRDDSGTLPLFTAIYEADLSALGGEESPALTAASPIVLAINNEAAA